MENFASPEKFWNAYEPFIIAFAVMAVLVFVLMRLLLNFRYQAEDELEALLKTNPGLYLERLNNNKRLKLVFRKPVLLLYRLDGYMKTGDDAKIREIISTLDGMRLEPRDKVEFLQRRMSFFVSAGETDEAKASFQRLSDYLHSVKADEVERYRVMLDEGEEIIRVYLDKDVSYMGALVRKVKREEHPVLRGVMYYRLSKLAYFKGDETLTQAYLDKAAQTLSGTDYEQIIRLAREDPQILALK